jgi:minor fimbrial subunit
MKASIGSQAAVALLMGLVTSTAFPATATVEGKVFAAPCVLVGGPSQTVDLGTQATMTLVNPGSQSDPKAFTVALENCPKSIMKVNVKFDASADPDDASTFKNAGTAQQVGVRIYPQETPTPIGPGSVINGQVVDARVKFLLRGAMYSAKGKAQAGTVDVTVPLVLSYE